MFRKALVSVVYVIMMLSQVSFASAVEIPEQLIEFKNNYPEAEQFVNLYPQMYDYVPEIDLSEEASCDYVPLLIQWDWRWGYTPLGDGFIGNCGCGPTCLSMVALYLTHDPQYTPVYIAEYAEENGYYSVGNGSEWELFSEGCEAFGIEAVAVSFDEADVKKLLDQHMPIICCMEEGDFTVDGHFVVLVSYDEEGLHINDPNSFENSARTWSFDTILSQTCGAWAYR